MKWFKKLSLGRSASQNKTDPIPADTGTERERGASGYARVNPIPNNLPCNSRFSDAATNGNRKCKHQADKRKDALWLFDVGGCVACNKAEKDNRTIATRLGTVVDSVAGSDVRCGVEYGLKSTLIASSLEHRNYNATSFGIINDDPVEDDLDLSEYVFVNEQDVTISVDPHPRPLEFLLQLGTKVEYGMTLDQVQPPSKQKQSAKAKETKRTGIAIQRVHLDVLDALNRSLMGPLHQSNATEPMTLPKATTTVRAACNMTREDSANVQAHFGLNDAGNIIIDVGHIEELRGEGIYQKKKYQKIFQKLEYADEVSEATRFHSTWKQLVRKIMICLRCMARGHPRNKTVFNGPGESIGTYALSLADDTESTFSRNISNFISCTKESKAAPQVVMRNMRQFMSGMKNYLVKHGEGEFANEVQKARSQLKSDEFLNLDSILEEVMHRLVILPLREHLYGLFVDYYTQSGDIQLLVEKVKQACGRGPSVFGIKNTVTPPSPSALRQISALFVRLQETELPLEKLDLLLTAVSTIFEATFCCNGQQLSADDFLPVLVLVVAHCGFIGAEIEAEYMWGLIQPSLLSGEAGYYLTALCSAVHVLKNFSLHDHEGISGSVEWNSSTLPECSSVLRVIIPDEYNGSIQTRTLPIRPHTTTKEVCRIIAHKARITNAQDYGLFKLIDGEETLLQDNECPQDVRMAACGKHCMIAYKRVDAKIAWPTVMPTSLTDNQ